MDIDRLKPGMPIVYMRNYIGRADTKPHPAVIEKTFKRTGMVRITYVLGVGDSARSVTTCVHSDQLEPMNRFRTVFDPSFDPRMLVGPSHGC